MPRPRAASQPLAAQADEVQVIAAHFAGGLPVHRDIQPGQVRNPLRQQRVLRRHGVGEFLAAGRPRLQLVAQGTNSVASNIAGVNEAATETGTAAGQVLTAADGLSRQADKLRADVNGFLDKIRAA